MNVLSGLENWLIITDRPFANLATLTLLCLRDHVIFKTIQLKC